MNNINKDGYGIYEVFVLNNGAVPKGLNVVQKSTDKTCVNPSQLELVSLADNVPETAVAKVGSVNTSSDTTEPLSKTTIASTSDSQTTDDVYDSGLKEKIDDEKYKQIYYGIIKSSNPDYKTLQEQLVKLKSKNGGTVVETI